MNTQQILTAGYLAGYMQKQAMQKTADPFNKTTSMDRAHQEATRFRDNVRKENKTKGGNWTYRDSNGDGMRERVWKDKPGVAVTPKPAPKPVTPPPAPVQGPTPTPAKKQYLQPAQSTSGVNLSDIISNSSASNMAGQGTATQPQQEGSPQQATRTPLFVPPSQRDRPVDLDKAEAERKATLSSFIKKNEQEIGQPTSQVQSSNDAFPQNPGITMQQSQEPAPMSQTENQPAVQVPMREAETPQQRTPITAFSPAKNKMMNLKRSRQDDNREQLRQAGQTSGTFSQGQLQSEAPAQSVLKNVALPPKAMSRDDKFAATARKIAAYKAAAAKKKSYDNIKGFRLGSAIKPRSSISRGATQM